METQDAKRAKVDQAAAAAPMAVDDAPQQQDAAGQSVAAPPDKKKESKAPRPLMSRYYKHLFPVQPMFKWLCYGNDTSHAAADGSFSSRRELCFTLEGGVFVRYQSYKNTADLATDLAKRVPEKIDIGPVYTHDPRQRAKYAKDFRPTQREVVIDIDISDYDDVRTCGKEHHMCSRCWPFMAVAIEVLDAALREDFGFKHILWVFSGRRGIHCWVADERARLLADDVRAAIVGFLSVIKGTEGGLTKLSVPRLQLHPSLRRAYESLETAWRKHILPEQELLEDPKHYKAILRYVPDEGIVSRLTQRWGANGQGLVPGGSRRSSAAAAAADAQPVSLSVRRWNELVQEVNKEADSLPGSNFKANDLRKSLQDIVFAYTYPRLDAEVTKKMNHLLKAPFCVHPGTGKVCVPIDPEAAWELDPDEVPTVQQLDKQLTEQQAAADGGNRGASTADGWKGTSMEAHVKYFTDSFLTPLTTSSRAALNERAKQAAADQRVQRDVSW